MLQKKLTKSVKCLNFAGTRKPTIVAVSKSRSNSKNSLKESSKIINQPALISLTPAVRPPKHRKPKSKFKIIKSVTKLSPRDSCLE